MVAYVFMMISEIIQLSFSALFAAFFLVGCFGFFLIGFTFLRIFILGFFSLSEAE